MWLPKAKEAVVKVAVPLTKLTPPGVRSVLPSMKSTVPVGVPVLEVMLAVNWTVWPKTAVPGVDVTAVVVVPFR